MLTMGLTQTYDQTSATSHPYLGSRENMNIFSKPSSALLVLFNTYVF